MATVYQFGEFTLDCERFELLRRGRRLKLERKPLELLVLLVAEHGQIVTREKIASCLWTPEVFVDIEHGVNTAVRKLRQALGDTPELPRFVQTISGSGYRFIAPVTTVEREIAASGADPIADNTEASELSAEIDSDETQPAALPGGDTRLAIFPPARNPRSRFRVVAALCASVVITIAGISIAIRPVAARFIHQERRGTIDSIAVLPLRNLSGDPGQEYFAAGMTDELTTELARIPNLRVVSRASVVANVGSSRLLPDIARQLNVDAIVDGSIMRSGDRIRITAQLIDARTDRHVWAQSFEGSGNDVLALQDNVAEQIAAQTRFALSPPSPRDPIDPGAHDAYLRGRYFFHKQDYARSLDAFKQAIALDAGYASAHAGYASALDAATTSGVGTPEQLMPQAIAAAKRAIQLDPQNGEAYTLLGSVQTIYSWNWTAAEQNLTRGIALNPSDSIAEFKYAVYLDAVGRTQDAVPHMRRALQLDPLSFLMTLRLGVALYYDRQYDAALAEMHRAAEMEQHAGSTDFWSSLIYEQQGNDNEAVQHDVKALQVFAPRLNSTALIEVYKKRGWQAYWRARTASLLASPAGPCREYEVGLDDLHVNEMDHAFDSFQHAVDQHCFSMAFIRVEPQFDAVRHDSRYAALLKRMHQ